MLQEYAELVQNIKNAPMWAGLGFQVRPDDRYYLTGNITHPDLAFRNQTGFDDWQEADRFASEFGYILDWEVL